MFDKVSEAAERLAVHVSRHAFLGSVGRWAGATALAMAGVLTTARNARADASKTCCVYSSLTTYCGCGWVCVKAGTPCPPPPMGCPSFGVSSYSVTACAGCKCKP